MFEWLFGKSKFTLGVETIEKKLESKEHLPMSIYDDLSGLEDHMMMSHHLYVAHELRKTVNSRLLREQEERFEKEDEEGRIFHKQMKKVELQFEDYSNSIDTTKLLEVSEITKVKITKENIYDHLIVMVNDKEIVAFSTGIDFEVNVKETE